MNGGVLNQRSGYIVGISVLVLMLIGMLQVGPVSWHLLPHLQRLILPNAELQPACDEGGFMGCIDHGGDIEDIMPWTKTLPHLRSSHPLHHNPLGVLQGPEKYIKHLERAEHGVAPGAPQAKAPTQATHHSPQAVRGGATSGYSPGGTAQAALRGLQAQATAAAKAKCLAAGGSVGACEKVAAAAAAAHAGTAVKHAGGGPAPSVQAHTPSTPVPTDGPSFTPTRHPTLFPSKVPTLTPTFNPETHQ